MELILASNNLGKIKEFSELLSTKVIPYKELLGKIEIEENGSSFAENALIKAKTIYEKLPKKAIVIADDSGISIKALNFQPGIFSARFAGVGASDKENLQKAIDELKAKDVNTSPAFYTAAIAIVSPFGEYIMHGWMHGKVITTPKGNKGFGYDPIFIPEGFDKTLGELDSSIKAAISHRAKALNLAKPIIAMLQNFN